MQKFTDSDVGKHTVLSRKLLSKCSQKTLQIAFFSGENIVKVKQLYNSHNDVGYVLKKMRKVELSEERLFCETGDIKSW